MSTTLGGALRAGLFATTALCVIGLAGAAQAEAVADAANDAPAAAADDSTVESVVVSLARTTRSAVSIEGVEMQKLLPGINPLKAIESLPGVSFQTADPWGNNEQNLTLFVHGFSIQQLGYTLDGVPLGDQQYGNYNGLSPQRAVISENVGKVLFSSGTADLGTASTSNLGGAIETFTSDPAKELSGQAAFTFGSYDTARTFLRVDTGDMGHNDAAYVSYLNQDARAWDFRAHQRGNQINAKYVRETSSGKFTAYAAFSDKIEPNEDSIVHPNIGSNVNTATAAALATNYTRPFLYPDYNGALAYLQASGAPPAADGNNFRNYHSAAQRTDVLGYVQYDWKLNPSMTWTNQAYYHYDYGRGIVAGPINQAGLPALFAVYYPGQTLKTVFGGTGYAVRTTEYLINRRGVRSNFDWSLGDHQIEIGGWIEQNNPQQHRAWYPFSAANNDLTPYDVPVNANFDQYFTKVHTTEIQLHIQDQWRITPKLLLQAGVKSSLQYAYGGVPIQQKSLPTNTNPTLLPTGSIDTEEYFLPQAGAVWDATDHEQVFFNVQKNLRQFIAYGAGGLSPWSLGSQAAFDLFKRTVNPETAWTYELGLRSKHNVDLGPLTGIELQSSVYHVDFSDRLLGISATPVIGSLVAGAAILANVGSVKTDGVDVAATLRFGQHFSFYDGLSYNRSEYQDNYATGAANTIVQTAGKLVPNSPEWLNKFVASVNYGPFEAQLNGDLVGDRYATYTNDLKVKGYFLLGLQASYRIPTKATSWFKQPKIALNVTNLTDRKGDYEVVVGQPANTYNTYPMPPRMWFITLSSGF